MNKIEQLAISLESMDLIKDDKRKETIRSIVNELIVQDFNQLVQFLYRVDVKETKLKKLLHDHPQADAAALITDLLIERRLEKIKTKASFSQKDDIPDEEKW
jgi:hypothetical protein